MTIEQNKQIMWGMAFLHGLVFYAPVAALYRQQAGITMGQMAFFESLCMVISMGLELPWGILAERIGYRRTMIGCCLLYFLSKLVFWQADGFLDFLLERVMLAVVLSGMSGVDEAILYRSAKTDSQKAFGVYYAAGEAGQLAAALLFSLFMGTNYRLAALATAVCYGTAAIFALFLKEPPKEADASEGISYGAAVKRQGRMFTEALKEIFQDRSLLWFLFGSALFTEVHQGITVFYGQLQYQQFQISPAAMGILYLILTLLGLSGRWSREVTGKLGENRAGGCLLLAAVFSCMLLSVLGAAASMKTGAVLSVGGIFLLRICYSLFAPWSMTWKNRRINGVNRAVSLSVCALLTDGAAAIVNLLLGNLAEVFLPLCMGVGAFLLVLATAAVLRAVKR